MLHIVGADLHAVHVGEVLEREQVEDAFRRSGDGDARHAFQPDILDFSQLSFPCIADVGAFDVALRLVGVGHVVEGEADFGAWLLGGQLQRDIVERALVVELLRDLGEFL